MSVPTLAVGTVEQLARLPLHGNVRELENLLHRAVALCDGNELQLTDFQSCSSGPVPLDVPAPDNTITPIPPVVQSEISLPSDLQSHLDQQERDILVKSLRETGFNRTLAASRLGLSLRQIRYRIARLKIDVPRDDDTDE
jgi:two-component system response regulator PilR (NtrC family)